MEVEDEITAKRADDDREGLGEAAQDVVGVLDGHCNEDAAQRLPRHGHPRRDAKPAQPSFCLQGRIIRQQ